MKFVHFLCTCQWNEHNQHYLSMKYTLVQFTSAPEYMSCYKWLPILVFKNKICYMHWYKTLAWWVIFRCQYTLTSNNQLLGCLNPPGLVLFSAVDVVAKHSSVNKTTLNAGSRFPKAFVSSAGILNLPITSIPVDNFNDWALWCKPTGINYNMHICADIAQQVDFDEYVVCGLWQCEALRASQKPCFTITVWQRET